MKAVISDIEKKVKGCYEEAPFPDTIRSSANPENEVDRMTKWMVINMKALGIHVSEWKPRSILCAGCGTGEEVICLSKIFPDSKITAIDISKSSLEIARENMKRFHIRNVTIKHMSILTDVPSMKDRYSLIFCSGVIHHLNNPFEGFTILSQKISANGKFVISLYNSYGLFFYRMKLSLLRLFSGTNTKLKMKIVQAAGLANNKRKALIYDSYLNPQVNTYTIEGIIVWAKKCRIRITGIAPPLNFVLLYKYAADARTFVLRRPYMINFILRMFSVFYQHKKETNIQLDLTRSKTIVFQCIYLFLGKGECFYCFER